MDDKLKIKVGVDLDQQLEQKIDSKLKNLKIKPMRLNVEFDTNNMSNLRKQLDDIAKEQQKLQGYANSKVSINTSNGFFDSAKIEYYNESLKEAVSTTYALDKETGHLYAKSGKLSTDYLAQSKAEIALNKQKLDFVNNQKIALDKLKNSYADSNALKSLDGNNLTELNSVYDNIITKTKELGNADKIRSEEIQREIKAEISSYEQLIKSKQNAQYVATSLRTKDTTTINAEEVNNLRKFEAQIKSSAVSADALEKDIKELHIALSQAFDKDSLTAYLNQLSIAKSKFGALKEEAKIQTNTVDNKKLEEQTKYYNKIKQELTLIHKLKKNLISAGQEESNEINKQIVNAQKRISYDEQQISKKKLYNQELVKEVNGLKLIQDAEIKISKAKQNDTANVKLEQQSQSLEKMSINAQKAASGLTIFAKQIKQSQIQKYTDEINKLKESLNNVKSPQELQKVNAQIGEFKNRVKAAGDFGDTFGTKLVKNLKNFSQFLMSGTLVMTFIRGIKSMISEVAELDKVLTEFNKVSDLSVSQLEKFTNQSFEMAKTIGRTGTEMIEAVTSFKKAGYDLQDSLEMGKTALVMTNIGDGIKSVEEASSALIATLKGFNLKDTDSMQVADMINSVANQSAIDFDNITEGLRRTSGTLSQTGASIQQTIGLLTGGFSSLRDIEMVSSGLIMISQRLRGIDEDGNAIDGLAPKLKSAFGAVGVEIEDVNGNLRSTYDILSDYAKIQDTLTTKQKQYLGELAAGNRQIKVLNAIMQGWEDVEKATLQATDSSGSAMRENEIFASSLQGHINQFKTTFQELSTEVVSSDLLKFIVDLGTTAFGDLDKLIKWVGLLPTAIGGVTIALSAMKKNAGISNVKYAHVT